MSRRKVGACEVVRNACALLPKICDVTRGKVSSGALATLIADLIILRSMKQCAAESKFQCTRVTSPRPDRKFSVEQLVTRAAADNRTSDPTRTQLIADNDDTSGVTY